MKPDITVDTRGLIAPITLLRVEAVLATMVSGQVMEVLSDDVDTRTDLISIVKNSGHQLISVRERSGDFRLIIKKGAEDGP